MYVNLRFYLSPILHSWNCSSIHGVIPSFIHGNISYVHRICCWSINIFHLCIRGRCFQPNFAVLSLVCSTKMQSAGPHWRLCLICSTCGVGRKRTCLTAALLGSKECASVQCRVMTRWGYVGRVGQVLAEVVLWKQYWLGLRDPLIRATARCKYI